MGNSLTVLGSSSGMPQSGRACSGYLLKVGQSCSIIDCGGGITSSFLKSGNDPLTVDRIFISHTHPDHVCELPLFIQLIYLKGRKKRLDIYVPNEFEKPLIQYLYSLYLIKERLPFELKIIGYEHRFEYYGNFSLDAYQTMHLQHYAKEITALKLPNKMQCHCFLIEVAGKKVFYSADIGGFEDIRDHLDGCKYAVVESTHINMENFLKEAKKFNVEQFIITHLGTPTEVDEINALITNSRIKNITIAKEGMELML